ncbi:SusD/RagB family nutrient-binding outer membrane lipoprotein [Rhodocytophaga aerolata]|uniref:SusD/RagB family nutrient-binding outer membrane lipoprotein n=1 Tax=Rhodocytophaga aerolata TaxID=455078 RepID=A0ABT8RFA4_9BACT|nr:SusD/RagB family nutrient-binding outer membrane lipoprotein [Rhodocytophaga aerolata]MDO1450371.1 SusD/RagB family nutrient-binding outer membrane lipoprotein [Rhodocytophaga aerolata]
MKKLSIVFIFLFSTLACQDDLTELNTDPKSATEVPAVTLFSNAQKNLTDIMTSTSVNDNVFRLLAQHWTTTTYTDEPRYDLNTRNIPQTFWNTLYVSVLRDLKEARTILEADESVVDEALKQNQLAQIEIMEVYAWQVLVNTFGDIPYTEALDYTIPSPKYDDASTVYNDLLTRLDAAIALLDESANSFGTGDLIYGGDIASWVKFANSLKLKMAMVIADVDAAKAQTLAEQAAPNVFTSNDDNAIFQYLPAPPNTNPIWVDLVQSGRQDFIVANTLVNRMNALGDPRLPFYFTPINGAYVGGTYGTSNNYTLFSKPAEEIIDPEFRGVLLDYAEVEFLLAEATERGFNVGGTAIEHYNAAVTASILDWGGTAIDAATYLLKPEVNYLTSGATFREKIGQQKWIALYNRGWDAWTEWRRLDSPQLQAPADAFVASVPVRFTYPVLEQTLNPTNYAQAVSAIGQDVLTNKLWWDVR